MIFVLSSFFQHHLFCNKNHTFDSNYQMIEASWIPQNQYPDEISILIADLKFDGTSAKICEFGEALESQFEGYKKLKQKKDPWVQFLYFLHSFNLPIWYVDKYRSQKMQNPEIKKLGCNVVSNLIQLEKDQQFKDIIINSESINSPIGIIAIRTLVNKNAFQFFDNQYPNILVLCRATAPYAQNKMLTCELFKDAQCMDFKPQFVICKKAYSKDLAQNIINKFNVDMYVIKPINGALGKGVIIVAQKDLDSTLNLILNNHQKLRTLRHDRTFSHWASDRQTHLIVEAYAPSKHITVDGKTYDPTMRLMFGLHNQNGRIFVTFFDAYWKLPSHGILDDVSLTDRHKSHIVSKGICSAIVDPHDFKNAKALLIKAFADLYLKMLENCFKCSIPTSTQLLDTQ
jgi:hypothetical protein